MYKKSSTTIHEILSNTSNYFFKRINYHNCHSWENPISVHTCVRVGLCCAPFACWGGVRLGGRCCLRASSGSLGRALSGGGVSLGGPAPAPLLLLGRGVTREKVVVDSVVLGGGGGFAFRDGRNGRRRRRATPCTERARLAPRKVAARTRPDLSHTHYRDMYLFASESKVDRGRSPLECLQTYPIRTTGLYLLSIGKQR